MKTSLIEKPAPGQFKAVCRLNQAKLLNELDAETYTALPEDVYSFWDKKLGGEAVFIQCAFETTDREAYVEHMTEHGKKPVKGENESWSRGIRQMWRGPALVDEGRPFKPSTKAVAADVRACVGCGLVAEVDDRAANALWWDEHRRGCEIAQAAS